MICGVKFNLDYSTIDQLLKNQNLEFKSQVNLETFEVDRKRIWKERGMTIIIKSPGYGIINGSLHMFKNGGHHNYDDFHWHQVSQTIDELSNVLGLDVRHLKLVNLEWGVNIQTEIAPKDILTCLVMHKGVRFEKMYVSPGTCYICSHDQFCVKVYDKGSQFRLPENILRIEIAANKSAFMNSFGIFTLDDLQYPETIANLQNSLLYGGWQDSLLIEPGLIHFNPLDKKVKQRLSYWTSHLYWLKSPNYTRCYQRRQYDAFRLNSGFDTKEKIFQAISDKFKEL